MVVGFLSITVFELNTRGRWMRILGGPLERGATPTALGWCSFPPHQGASAGGIPAGVIQGRQAGLAPPVADTAPQGTRADV